MYFCSESEGIAHAVVIRIGALGGRCSVRIRTVDASAVAGVKYEPTNELLEFGPGESEKTVQIPIVDDDNFDPTLDFKLVLKKPENCTLGLYLNSSQVLIIDDDIFHSNDFRSELEQQSDDALLSRGVALLLANARFMFSRVPTVRWKSVLVAAMDQFQNLYYLMTIFLKVYLIDVVLNLKDEESEKHLWVAGNRGLTASIVALLMVLPNLVILIMDRLKVGPLEMSLTIKSHFQTILLQKYLNYSDASREKIQVTDLMETAFIDIPDIAVKGYLTIFPMLESGGRRRARSIS